MIVNLQEGQTIMTQFTREALAYALFLAFIGVGSTAATLGLLMLTSEALL